MGKDKLAALVRIICDGGGKFGFGNLRRSSTLGAAFKQHGYRVFVDVLSAGAQSIMPSSPADGGKPDLWLIDLPYNGDDWVAKARAQDIPVAALDYEGSALPDLTIDLFDRGTAPKDSRHVVGMEYAIIRPEFRKLRSAEPGQAAIVVIGGGDQKSLGEDAALRIHALGVPVVLVEGPLAEKRKQLPSDIIRLAKPIDLPSRMAASAWGVTGAGGAMFEMLYLGRPTYVLPRTSFEEALARLMFEKGALLGIGLEALRVPPAELSARVSANGRALIDGNGADRIVSVVCELL